MTTTPSHVVRGFTLVEMAVVLAIVGLVAGMLLQVSSASRDAQNRQLVRTQLTAIDVALANFVALNKRLPCPANGLLAPGTAGAGIEAPATGGPCAPATQVNGVIPYVTLHLPVSAATDPWNAQFTYRVDPALASSVNLLMNMTNCDPAGTGATTASGACLPASPPCINNSACTSPANFLTNKGLYVSDGVNMLNNPAPASGAANGAAYVTISHGANGAGAYNTKGVLQPGTGVVGTSETPNLNGPAANVRTAAAGLANPYRDTTLNDIAAPAHFDDYLSHPTILSVLIAANLGHRAN